MNNKRYGYYPFVPNIGKHFGYTTRFAKKRSISVVDLLRQKSFHIDWLIFIVYYLIKFDIQINFEVLK